MQPEALFALLILFFSIILHEVAHGYMANWLGDPTARLQGRLTLNPLSHIDPIGTILLPLIMWAGQGFAANPVLIGYAKPVPYNPYNLPGKYDEALVAFAGPAVNLILALVFGLTIRFAGATLGPGLLQAFTIIVIYNVVLALFNLIPIPPLDGSKVLSGIFALISRRLEHGYALFRANFERLGVLGGTLLLFVIFYLVLVPYFYSVATWCFSLLTGQTI